MLRVIIVDDELKGIDTLKLLLTRYVPEVRIVACTSDPLSAVELINNFRPEIIFLDINMPGMNGFELLEKLHWKTFNLIFTTAHQEFGIKAIKNDAVDYLLKPIDHSDLRKAVDRVQRKLSEEDTGMNFDYQELMQGLAKAEKQKIIINSREGVDSVDTQEINFLEASSNYTRFNLTGRREITASRPLKEFDHLLCGNDSEFIRVHNSFIVNFLKVVKYLKAEEIIIMDDGQRIPLSKSRKDLFLKRLGV